MNLIWKMAIFGLVIQSLVMIECAGDGGKLVRVRRCFFGGDGGSEVGDRVEQQCILI